MNSRINEIASKLKLIKCNNKVFLDLISKRFPNSKISIKYSEDHIFNPKLLNSGNYYLIDGFEKYTLFKEEIDFRYYYTTFPGIKLDVNTIDIDHYSYSNSLIFKSHLEFRVNLFKIVLLFINNDIDRKILNVGFLLSDLIKLYEEISPLESNLKFEDYVNKKSLYLIKLLETIYKSDLTKLFIKKISIKGFLGIIETLFSKDNDFILIETILNNIKNDFKSHYIDNSKMKLYELLNIVLHYARKYFIDLFYHNDSSFDRYFDFVNMIIMNVELFESFNKIYEI